MVTPRPPEANDSSRILWRRREFKVLPGGPPLGIRVASVKKKGLSIRKTYPLPEASDWSDNGQRRTDEQIKAPLWQLTPTESVSPKYGNLPGKAQLFAALEYVVRSVCSLGIVKTRRNDDDLAEELGHLDLEPARRPNLSAGLCGGVGDREILG